MLACDVERSAELYKTAVDELNNKFQLGQTDKEKRVVEYRVLQQRSKLLYACFGKTIRLIST